MLIKKLVRIVVSSILCLTWSCSTHRQQTFKDTHITWKVLGENNHSEQMISELILHNASNKDTIPASGWTLYFNAENPKTLDQDSSIFKTTHINGDFFKLTPGKSFKGLAPQKAIGEKIVSNRIRNLTDFATGFYLVQDDIPAGPVLIPLEIQSEIDHKEDEKELARAFFQQNQSVPPIDTQVVSPIFPTPSFFQSKEGAFELSSKTTIICDGLFIQEAGQLSQTLKNAISGNFSIQHKDDTNDASKNSIILRKSDKHPTEGYELTVSSDQILLSASTSAGIFYGIQSLKTMLPATTAKLSQITIPSVDIIDEPRFGHRAFMMDIARNFQPKSQIRKVLDLLALYKMNVLHLHFNDDEGWRIEINGLPELTNVGSKRGHTLTEDDRLFPSYGSGPFIDQSSGSGHLTRADFIEILKYAHARHIKVIPEYETPGHARAAIKAMDARYKRFIAANEKEKAEEYLLRDLEDQSVYRSIQNFDDNIINPALPSVYRFMEKIVDETIAMYKEAGAPLETIHFGGDEVPEGVWEKSPAVKALLDSNPDIAHVDELWYYYFHKVNSILKERGLYLSGWEEIGLQKKLNKKMVLDPRFANENFHTDVWNNLKGNEDLAYILANAGYKVVLTNVTNMYIDLAYNKSYYEMGQYWGGYVDVDKPYRFIPFDYYRNQKEDQYGKPIPPAYYEDKVKLNESSKKNIVGLQSPLWSEKITSKEKFEYLFLPKILGLAERAWTPDPLWANEQDSAKSQKLYEKDWAAFLHILGYRELPRLDYYVGGFAYRIPTAGYRVTDNMVEANVQYPNLTIRYTLDGSEPTVSSKEYTSPIPYAENIRLKVFNQSGRSGRSLVVLP